MAKTTVTLRERNGVFLLDIQPANGPRKRVSLHTRDRAVAEERHRQALAATEVADSGRHLFPDMAQDYLEVEDRRLALRAEGHLAASTLAIRRRQLEKAARILGPVPMPDLGQHLTRWQEAMLGEGASAKTLQNHLDGLKDVGLHWIGKLAQAGASELPRNPVALWIEAQRHLVGRKRRTKSARRRDDIRALTPEQSARFLAAAERLYAERLPHVYGAILMAHDTGMRLGELRAIEWSAVTLGSGREDRSRNLYVSKNSPCAGLRGEETKTGEPRRVHLSWRLREWIRTERARRIQKAWAAPSGEIFGPFDGSTLRYHLARVCREAKLPVFTVLELRHTFASQLFSAGYDLGYVSRQLGNSPAICKKHYAKFQDSEGYVEPAQLAPWEVPADLLARSSAPAPSAVSAV